ncbi:MAG TPA: response regulator transcription factor [Anditalea sp.]|nr:response regulator transcription factor [Anditalea sp.]
MNRSIAIVDDHEIFLMGLAHMLESNFKIPVIGKFRNGQEVMDFLEKGHKIDLLIIDLNMPVMDGTTLLANLFNNFSTVKKLVLSMHADAITISRCKELGADGYLSKDVVWSDLEEAIKVILDGGSYFITEDVRNESDPSNSKFEYIIERYHLTKREMQILQLLLKEYLISDIAEKLYSSPFTINTYKINIFKKLGVNNVAGMVTLLEQGGYNR